MPDKHHQDVAQDLAGLFEREAVLAHGAAFAEALVTELTQHALRLFEATAGRGTRWRERPNHTLATVGTPIEFFDLVVGTLVALNVVPAVRVVPVVVNEALLLLANVTEEGNRIVRCEAQRRLV